jgi:hypothetical protein
MVLTTADRAKALKKGDLEIAIRIAENEVTERDIVALGFRRKQLIRFERMLNEPDYFSQKVRDRSPEAAWQNFFEGILGFSGTGCPSFLWIH